MPRSFMVLLIALSSGVHAATAYQSIEEAAKVTEANVTRFENDSIAKQGTMLRFDVTVGWKDPSMRKEEEPLRKIIRHLAKCDEGELALASVALVPGPGQLPKTFGIAPGAWDFYKPEKGTEPQKWLDKVCDWPLR